MYSTNKAAFKLLVSSSSTRSMVTSNQGKKTWQEAFQSAIQQLSLAEAAQDAQENRRALPCREKERAQITNFLKKAICGMQSNNHEGGEEEETRNLKSSLFIAGPP